MDDQIVQKRPGGRAYDLVAIDVDGTLLNSHDELTPAVAAALRKARAAGVIVALVSGRGKTALEPFLRDLGLGGPFVASGGAYIADPSNGGLIENRAMRSEDAAAVVKMARAAGAWPFYESPDWMVCEGPPRGDLLHSEETGISVVHDLTRDAPGPPTKVSVLGPVQNVAVVEEGIRRSGRALTAVNTASGCLDVYGPNVSKGSAVAALAQHLGVPLERVMAIGDYDNDRSMFEVVGLAVAMGNAPLHVQAVADVIAPSNDEDGVEWALRTLLPLPGEACVRSG